MNTLKKIRANQKGFTLVELIVVVAILGVLAAVAVPNYMNYLYKSRVNSDINTAMSIIRSARTFYITTGTAPTLEAVIEDMDMGGTPAATQANDGDTTSLLTVLGEIQAVGSTDAPNDKFEIVVTAGDKAGKYAGNTYTVTENEELPTADTPDSGSAS